MSKKISDTEYLYLSAMLKAREANMLTRDKLERMLAAGSFNDAAKLLQESGWPDMSGLNAAGVDKALSERRREIFAELERSLPEKALLEIFRARYDYHNAKAIIKGEGIGVNADHILSGAGRVDSARLEESFREDDFRYIPEKLGAAMAEAKGVLARTDNPQAADFVLDKAYFAEILSLADEVSAPFAAQYVAIATFDFRPYCPSRVLGEKPRLSRHICSARTWPCGYSKRRSSGGIPPQGS